MTRCLASAWLYALSLSVRKTREVGRWEKLKLRQNWGEEEAREQGGERSEGKVKRQGDERGEKEA